MRRDELQQASSTRQQPRLRVGDLVVDLDRRTVQRGAELLDVTDRSFRLLESLVRHATETVSKDTLIADVWDDAVVSDETLAQRVRLLRQSLGDDSQKPRYIAAVRGRGYRLVADVGDAPAVQSGNRPNKLLPGVGIAAAVAVLLALFLVTRPGTDLRAPDVLAVLPFADLSVGQDQQYFADGMHEELLSQLAMVEDLAVISRTSVERFRGSGERLPDIAAQLGANAVLEGSVRVDDDQVRVTVQLIDASSDEHIWAGNFDRQLSMQNIFALQADVATRIAESLELEYARTADSGAQLPTTHLDAYNLYLLGRYHTFKQTRQDLDQAVDYLEQAVAIDAEFAEAYATLGWAYSFLGTEYGSSLPREAYPKAKEAALRAIAIDADLADARSLYADILTWYDWDFEAAEREYLKTIELDPLNVLGYALFLSTQERHDEAITLIELRLAADPKDPYVRINAGWRYLSAGQTDKAIEAAIAANDHRDSSPLIGWSRLARDETDLAVDVFEAAIEADGRTPGNLANLAVAYFRNGRTVEGEKLLEELEEFAVDNYVSPGQLANIHFAAGDADQGFELLDVAFEQRHRDMIFLRVTEALRGYRDDPRYIELVQNVGLVAGMNPG